MNPKPHFTKDYKDFCVGNSVEADIILKGKAEGKTHNCLNCLRTKISVMGNMRNYRF